MPLCPGEGPSVAVANLHVERRHAEHLGPPLELVEERGADPAPARRRHDPHVGPCDTRRRVPAGREPTGADRSPGLLPEQPHGQRRLALPVEEVRDHALLAAGLAFRGVHDSNPAGELVLLDLADRGGAAAAAAAHATTRYTWKTSAYSRFTLMPCVRARLRTYSAFA